MEEILQPPYYSDYINAIGSSYTPSTVHVKDSMVFSYFMKYLLEKAMSAFKFSFPETWARNYVLYTLYCNGYFTVFNTDKFGKIPQHCTLYGYNVQWQPTDVLIANPLIKTRKLRIGVDCSLIKLQPNYSGILDICAFYASQMALATETASTNIFNSKLSYIFYAKDRAQAETYKKAYDKVSAGEPAVVIDKIDAGVTDQRAWEPFQQNVKQNYIYSDILADLRTLELRFDTEVGIPNAGLEKRERKVVDEVNSNNVETASKCELWLDCLKEDFEKCRKMFGFSEEELNVDWRIDPNDNVRSTEQEKGVRDDSVQR